MLKKIIPAAVAIAFATSPAFAADDHGTADEAIAMVKKAVAFIKKEGAEKSYAAITAKDPQFKDRDLYIMIYDLSGKCVAHGANPKLVGKDLIENQDTDGVFYVKERMELAKTKASFWQDYKFTNPTSKKVEPKSAYCEKLESSVVCSGIYK